MKILIVKTSALVDIVHVFPVIDFIKSLFPDAIIDWVVEKGGKDLLEAHADIRKVLVADTKGWRKRLFSFQTYREAAAFIKELRSETYDVLFDFQGNVKSGL